jgi:molybdate transport system substrate-binding protein
MIRRKPLTAVARPWAAVLVAFVLLGALAATTTSVTAKFTTTTKKATTTTTAAPTTTTTVPKLNSDITVLAAASLTEAFTEIGKSFEAANPNIHVKFSSDSSSSLATLANNGAPAEVFASADEANMKKVTDAGNASDPKIFVRNRLAVIVQKNNPSGISKLADVNDTNKVKRFVICALQVPCGNYAKQAMDKAGVTGAPDSYEANVIANYPIAILKQSTYADAARVWIDYLLTPQGQAVLAKYGFIPAA